MPVTHFITAPTFHHKRLFQNELYGDLLTDVLMRWRQEYSVALHDYVIMPDHLHLLITSADEAKFAAAFTHLQQVFSRELNSQYGYNGEVWNRAVRDRVLEDAADAKECVKKIHSNPVRGGYCANPGQYRMSSKSSHWTLDPLPEHLRERDLQQV